MRQGIRVSILALAAALGGAVLAPSASAGPVTFETVALTGTGNPAPDTGGDVFLSLGEPALNDGGDTAFFSAFGSVPFLPEGAIFKESGGSLGLVARTDDVAPGTSGALFSGFGDPALNGGGDTAFTGNLIGTGVTSINDIGIFKENGGSLGLVAREGDVAPLASFAVFSDFSDPALNAGGDTAFSGNLRAGSVTPDNDVGIFKESGGSLVLVAREGDVAPGTSGALFSTLSSPALNDGGDTAFASIFAGTGVTPSNSEAIFKESGGSLGLVARAGDIAPDTGGAEFSTLSSPALNDGGDTAFSSFLTGTGVTPSNSEAIFKESGGSLGLVAREGDVAPGTSGALFSGFDDPALNINGDTAFFSFLDVPSSVNPKGSIWFKQDGGSLELILREGDLLEVAPGDMRTVQSLSLSEYFLNDLGQVAFGASFIDGTEGVFVASVETTQPTAVPLPATLMLLGWGLALVGPLAVRRR